MFKISSAVALFMLVAPSIFGATINLVHANLNMQLAEDRLGNTENYALKLKCDLSFACFENRHYYFETKTKRTRDDAVKFCRTINMSLISVENCAENTFITNSIKDNDCYKKNFWTSGYRTTTDVWYWGAGNVFNYTNWMRAEPTFGRNEYCVLYRNSYVQWSDEVCGNKNYFICESNNACS